MTRLFLPLGAALLAAGGCGKSEQPQVSEATLERFILKQEQEEAAEKAVAIDQATAREQARAPKDRQLIRKAERDVAADKRERR